MSEKLKELQAKRGEMHKAITDLADKQESWNAEDRAKWDVLNKEYDKFTAEELQPAVDAAKAEEAERASIDARLAALDGHQDHQPAARNRRIGRDGATLQNAPANRRTFANGAAGQDRFALQSTALQGWMLAGRYPEDVQEEHVEAARQLGISNLLGAQEFNLTIGGTSHIRNTQQPFKVGSRSRGGSPLAGIRNDMSEGSLSKGGALVGETLLTSLEVALLSYSGVLQYAEIMVTDTGEVLRWPTMDDTANTGTRVGENQDATSGLTSTDPKTGRLNLNAFTFTSGGLNVSRSLMNDAPTNLVGMFGNMLGTRIGRKQNVDFTTGADVGNGPTGVMTAATSGVTGASTTAIAFDELIDLVHSVDPAYREQEGVGYSFHDSILQVIRKIKDGTGRYLWSMGTNAMEPDRLNGFVYYINQSMDKTIASGKKTVLFGKLDEYKVRFVNSIRIQRLIERRAEYDEDVFIAYMRGDGGLLDAGTHPVKYLTH